MYIREFFMDRYEPAHLVDQAIHDMELIGDTSAEEANGMDQLFKEVFVGQWSRRVLNVSIYVFYSRIGIRNRLVTPPINEREGMEGGGENTSAKEGNAGREWLSTVNMTGDGGWRLFYDCVLWHVS